MARRDYFDDPDAPAPNAMVPAATVFVSDGSGKVLLVKRVDNGLWALPGGVIEFGESASMAAIREVKEETGIDVEVTGLVGIYSDPRSLIAYDDGEVRQQFTICFRADVVGGELSGSDESTEVRWVDQAELADLQVLPVQRLRIDHGFERGAETPFIG